MRTRASEVFEGIPLSTARLICLRFGAISPGHFDELGAEAFLLEKADKYCELIAQFSALTHDDGSDEFRRHIASLLVEGAVSEAEELLSQQEKHLSQQEKQARRTATRLRERRASIRAERGQVASASFDARTAANHFASAAKIVGRRNSERYTYYKSLEASEWITLGFESTKIEIMTRGIEILASDVAPILKEQGEFAKLGDAVATEAQALIRTSIWSRNTKNAEDAANNCRETIAALDEEEPKHRGALCRLHTQLAFACFVLFERNNNPSDLERAMAAISSAERLRERRLATDYAFSIFNVKGNILWSLARNEDSEETVRKCIKAYKKALSLVDKRRFPLQFGMATNNLADALRILAKVTGSARYADQAISKFKEALEVRTKSGRPHQWALSKNNLGTTIKNLGEISRDAETVLSAIAHFEDAQSVWISERFPQHWAMAEGNIGASYLSASKLSWDAQSLSSARHHLARSVEAFEKIGHQHFVEMHRDYLEEAIALQHDGAK